MRAPGTLYRVVGGGSDGLRVPYGGREIGLRSPQLKASVMDGWDASMDVTNPIEAPVALRYTLREISCRPQGCTVHFYAPAYMTDYEVLRSVFT
jgi:hypothetical protein